MALSPQKFREMLLQLLFSRDFHESSDDELQELIMIELKVTASEAQQAQKKVKKIVSCFPEIDSLIAKVCTGYEFHRIQHVERTILRIAVYELLYEKELSTATIIAEAKRLAKKFSTPEAMLFCQAIIDTISKMKEVQHVQRVSAK